MKENINQTTKRTSLTDQAFRGLPTQGIQKEIQSVLDKKEKNTVDKIISGEILIIGKGKKEIYIDKATGYYVYTFTLSDNKELAVIFYRHTNKKVLIHFEQQLEEIVIPDNSEFFSIILSHYNTLPKYTTDELNSSQTLNS